MLPLMHATFFLTTKEEDFYNFESINLKWKKDVLHVSFIKDGFVTELYFLLACIKKIDSPVKSIFLVSKDENRATTKYSLSIVKILNLSYPEFVDWITNRLAIHVQNKSGSYEELTVVGLEIRFHKDLDKELFPTKTGCSFIEKEILSKWKTLTL